MSILVIIGVLSLIAVSKADKFDDLQSQVFDATVEGSLGEAINLISDGYTYTMDNDVFKDWAKETRQFQKTFEKYLNADASNYYKILKFSQKVFA